MKILVICLLVLFTLSLNSQFQDEKIEPQINSKIIYHESKVLLSFSLDRNYHFANVNNDMFNITLKDNEYFKIEKLIKPKGLTHDGEIIYKGEFEVEVMITQIKKLKKPQKFEFVIDYQICQEVPEEMCLAPENMKLNLIFEKDFKGQGNTTEDVVESSLKDSEDLGFLEKIENSFKEKLAQGSLVVFLFAFIAGLLASLTPCVYPVIPIVMGYVGSKSKDNKFKGFYLSLFFSLGLALVYSVLGVIAASSHSVIGAGFQNPIVIVIIASIFILMGLSMAGLFNIPVPSSISSKMQTKEKGGILGAMIIGGVSAVIAAPCVGPVLIAILTMVAQEGNLVYGFLLTFTFSMGLSVLFILAGTFSGVISSMPKGGKWMTYIKYVFSLLLLISGIFVLSKVLPEYVILIIWGIFLISFAVIGNVFNFNQDKEVKEKMGQIFLILIILIGSLLFVKGINKGFFAEQITQVKIDAEEKLPWMHDLETALARAKSEQKIVMLDSYTDWCVTCKKLDKKTFQNPEVSLELNKIILVKINFTKESPKNVAIKGKYQIIGFPTVLFLNQEGEVIDRFSTFLDKKRFLKKLEKAKNTK